MPKRPRTPSPPIQRPSPLAPLATRMRYSIGRGEQGVLTFEPYKGYLLPLWRFKTPEIAEESARRLQREFQRFEGEGDFVGCDMARKFIQMGMTRSMRYANRAGGRKYSAEDGSLLPKSSDHPGAKDKLASAAIFREVWERVKGRERYAELRKEWEKEKKEWLKSRPKEEEGSEAEDVKREDGEEAVKQEEGEEKPAKGKKRMISGAKKEDKPTSKRRRVKKEEDASD
ncbi:hypothetical protein RTG_03225 [Rhodotorula toruloides ATCC 204091]|uniref:DUF4385 multi-domain protein n=1 Tax=Rhodotorula toruloides TaxID=5286 RepID=A0A0K3CNQ0_RHOTO|nr:hypothetical protein RTG_03225 [Rhodotorula toruloides ATCC 204091]PRQ70630.1 protein of unknown function (DUF4385)-domain containing protein [Rhodotorula toruloides]